MSYNFIGIMHHWPWLTRLFIQFEFRTKMFNARYKQIVIQIVYALMFYAYFAR